MKWIRKIQLGDVCGLMIIFLCGAAEGMALQGMWYSGHLPLAVGFSIGCISGAVMLTAAITRK